ncbi:methionyl-tRNA formyltransferase [Paracraurococcus lichenis]|uniref:Formyltransferase family protein n=1 Tax=Paracraurococcus lichenis TaxID=3064888 RepID=A0ABT9E732_9PROT|nr:formyltransferase family protein [Paracraurococcus sp. LOR1-02]MDO9711996.1 formyltransferase family protein [Paracraurococcus sp. LOR1-02]
MRIALFTLEAAPSEEAVARFLDRHGGEVVLIGRSDPFRPAAGGALRQGWRHLRRSGPRLLPFLWINYALPGLRPGPTRLARIAAARGIPLHAVRDVNGPETAAAIRAARPDLILSCHFDQIFAAETLALAPLGGINLHPSLLPRHRGPVPTIWALAEETPRFGVSVHRLVPRIDAGGILAQREVPLPPGTTASAAARALHLAGLPLLAEVLARLGRGPVDEIVPAPLPYCPFPPPALLRGLARRGRRLVDAGDLRAALGHGLEAGSSPSAADINHPARRFG